MEPENNSVQKEGSFDLETFCQRFPSLDAILRSNGFIPTPHQWICIQDLILNMNVVRAKITDAYSLCCMMSPVFCTSEKEQERFFKVFQQWQWQWQVKPIEEKVPPIDEKRKYLLLRIAAAFNKRGKYFLLKIAVGLIALVLSIVIYFVVHKNEEKPNPQSVATSSSSSSHSSASSYGSSISSVSQESASLELGEEPAVIIEHKEASSKTTIINTMLTGFLYAFFIIFISIFIGEIVDILLNYIKYTVLRLSQKPEGKTIYLKIKEVEKKSFANKQIDFFINKTVPLETRSLNEAKTISASILKGMFTPVMKMRRCRPTYLILTEFSNSLDHEGFIARQFMEVLDQDNVDVHYFYFNGSFRWFYRDIGDRYQSFDLKGLSRSFQNAKLIIIGDAKILFDSANNALDITNDLSSWASKLWVTNVPTPWSYREAYLTKIGFNVTELSYQGLASGLSFMSGSQTDAEKGKWIFKSKPENLPDAILSDYQESHFLNTSSYGFFRLRHLIRHIHEYLGPDGFKLLSAIATFPTTVPKLTISLEEKLFPISSPEERQYRLSKISRLPWLKNSKIPVPLRRAILNTMDKDSFKKVTALYDDLFEESDEKDSDLHLFTKLSPKAASSNTDVPQKRWVHEKLIFGLRSRSDFLLPEAVSKIIRPLTSSLNKYAKYFIFGFPIIVLVFIINSLNKNELIFSNPEMVEIPAFSFTDANSRNIQVSPFEIGNYEVTVREFAQFVFETNYITDAEYRFADNSLLGCFSVEEDGATARHSTYSWRNPGYAPSDNHFVVCVSPQDVLMYISWLNEKTKATFRLPTKEEWELVARGEKGANFSSPSMNARSVTISNKSQYFNVIERSSDTPEMENNRNSRPFSLDAMIAGQKKLYSATTLYDQISPNYFGVSNMHLGVREWVGSVRSNRCQNVGLYLMQYPEKCNEAFVAGGSWFSDARFVKFDSFSIEQYPQTNIGFRLAR